jgi:TM2 domain-containing membrane protein YozV
MSKDIMPVNEDWSQGWPGTQSVQPKSPAAAIAISFFIPGVGSMYAGNSGVGVAILVTYLVGCVLSLVLIGIPIVIAAWIWGMVNGNSSAIKWNRDHGIIS